MLLFPNKNRTADQSLSPLSNLIKSMQTNLTGKKGQLYKMHPRHVAPPASKTSLIRGITINLL